MIIDELVTLLGLKVDPQAQREAGALKAALGGITSIATAVGVALAAAAAAVQAYAFKQAEGIAEGKRFADMLSVSYERLQELEFGARSVGGSADDLRGDLERLTKSMSSPIPGEYNQTLYMLGISARDSTGKLRSADDVLKSIADKLSGMSKQRQLQFAERLGLSKTSLRLVQEGRAGIEKLAQEARGLGVVLDSQTGDQAVRFKRALEGVQAAVDGVGRAVTSALLPGLETGAKLLANWISANRALIASGIQQVVEGVGQGFQIVADVVGLVWRQVTKLVGPVEGLAEAFDATQVIAVTTAIAIGAVAVAVISATWPFLAIAAAIAAVVFVVEDLYSYFKGGKSIIGDWVDSFVQAYPNISAALVGIGKLVGWLAELLGKRLWGSFKEAGSALLTMLGRIADAIMLPINALEKLLGLVRLIPESLYSSGADQSYPKPSAAASTVPASVMAGIMRPGAGGPQQPLVGTLQINGAGDPMAVGDAVARSLGLGESVQSVAPGMTGPTVW